MLPVSRKFFKSIKELSRKGLYPMFVQNKRVLGFLNDKNWHVLSIVECSLSDGNHHVITSKQKIAAKL